LSCILTVFRFRHFDNNIIIIPVVLFSGGSDGYTYNSQKLYTSLLGSTPSSVITDDCISKQRFL